MARKSNLTVKIITNGLLQATDPSPVGLVNAEGTSPFLLIGDHAGSAIPHALGDLGLSPVDRRRHIALDIGVMGLGQELARLLDAPFLHQPYSRLVIDCNRGPYRTDAIPAVSDGSDIAGNEGLDEAARLARVLAIHRPYHTALTSLLDARQSAGRDTILLSLHSFTPVMNGIARPWHVGIMHWRGRTDFAQDLLQVMATQSAIVIGDNEPYVMDDTDFTIPHHAFARRLAYAEVEVRQDLISTVDGETQWAARLAASFEAASRRCLETDR